MVRSKVVDEIKNIICSFIECNKIVNKTQVFFRNLNINKNAYFIEIKTKKSYYTSHLHPDYAWYKKDA